MKVLTSAQLTNIGIAQGRSLAWRNELAKITLPYVPGTRSRFAQRPYEASSDRRGSNMKLTKPRRLFDELATHSRPVRLVHMKGGATAIPDG